MTSLNVMMHKKKFKNLFHFDLKISTGRIRDYFYQKLQSFLPEFRSLFQSKNILPVLGYLLTITAVAVVDSRVFLDQPETTIWRSMLRAVAFVAISNEVIRWLYKKFSTEIYSLVLPVKNIEDIETRRISNSIAFIILIGLVSIIFLLALDFFGHARSEAISLRGLLRLDIPTSKIGKFLGSFGDFFGGVLNPILTFLSFVTITVTVVMQRIQLKESGELSRLQTFETTFFNMVNLHSNSVLDLHYEPSDFKLTRENISQHTRNYLISLNATDGNRNTELSKFEYPNISTAKSNFETDYIAPEKETGCTPEFSQDQMDELNDDDQSRSVLESIKSFKTANRKTKSFVSNRRKQAKAKGRDVFASILKTLDDLSKENDVDPFVIYAEIQINHNYILGRYFRNLYQILEFIDQYASRFVNEVGSDELPGKRYADILRAQLSSDELLLLFYNCSSKLVDQGQFRELLKKYEILEHMSIRKTSKFQLGAPGFSFEITPHVEQYFEFNDDKDFETTGAFGKNPVIDEFAIDNYNNKSN